MYITYVSFIYALYTLFIDMHAIFNYEVPDSSPLVKPQQGMINGTVEVSAFFLLDSSLTDARYPHDLTNHVDC